MGKITRTSLWMNSSTAMTHLQDFQKGIFKLIIFCLFPLMAGAIIYLLFRMVQQNRWIAQLENAVQRLKEGASTENTPGPELPGGMLMALAHSIGRLEKAIQKLEESASADKNTADEKPSKNIWQQTTDFTNTFQSDDP
jgi:hypothetical protein